MVPLFLCNCPYLVCKGQCSLEVLKSKRSFESLDGIALYNIPIRDLLPVDGNFLFGCLGCPYRDTPSHFISVSSAIFLSSSLISKIKHNINPYNFFLRHFSRAIQQFIRNLLRILS